MCEMWNCSEAENERRSSCSSTESGNCKLRRSRPSRRDWFPIYLILLALPVGVRDMPWHCISLELQMTTVRGSSQTKEYVDGWIYLNMKKKKKTLEEGIFFPFSSKLPKIKTKWQVNLVINVKFWFWCQSINWNFLSSAASAFSERYLGLPKPDPRAYTVRSRDN